MSRPDRFESVNPPVSGSPPEPHAVDWGRRRGAEPPLAPRAPLLWWLAMALVLTAVIVVLVGGPGPLDDPQQGRQRPGLLTDAGDAPVVRNLGLPRGSLGQRPVFLAFDRRIPSAAALERILDQVPDDFATVLVVPAAADLAESDLPLPVVTDARGRLAHAVGLARPKDGGPPVGYVVIDAAVRVRYATLDPDWTDHGDEIAIVTQAAR